MSGRHPLIKGYFRFCTSSGAVMSSAFCAGMRIPLALMLSANPVPNQPVALRAPTMPRALGSIRFLHITSWSPSTPIRLQALSLGGNLSDLA